MLARDGGKVVFKLLVQYVRPELSAQHLSERLRRGMCWNMPEGEMYERDVWRVGSSFILALYLAWSLALTSQSNVLAPFLTWFY